MTQLMIVSDRASLLMSAAVPVAGATSRTQRRSYQASVYGTGAVTASVSVYGANDPRFPVLIGSFTLSGTGSASDALVDDFPWEFVFAQITALTGTNALVSVFGSI